LASTGTIPVASIGLILGVHRLLSSAFVPVNVLGNALATIVIARMERAVDMPTLESELRRDGRRLGRARVTTDSAVT
jgi:aerobic C4-dicarboxylate transport protein